MPIDSVHGPQAAPPAAAGHAAPESLVKVDLAQHLKRGEPLRILGNAVVALAAAVAFRDTADSPTLACWLGAMLACAAFNGWAAWRVWSRPLAAENTARRLRRVRRVEAVNGLLWMTGELLFLPGADYAQRGLFMVLLSGLGAGVMQSLSAYLPALYLFFGPPVLGFVMVASALHGPYFGPAVALMLIWTAVNLNFARMMHRTLVESLRNRHITHALANDLQVQRDRAVELSQARSRFLAAASHDLRQPVHALSLLVGALKQSPTAAESTQIVGHLGAAVDAMGTMFNALLDISKLDADLLQPNWQDMDLRWLLERIARDQAVLADAKGLAFHCELPAGLVLPVRTDPVLLERVLRNLLSNAIRYTSQGFVRIRVRARCGHVEVVVADTGVGIPRARQADVFKEFVQLHQTHALSEQGLGLGLSIVQRLSGLLQLRLKLRSRPGRGTHFTVRLPLLASAAESLQLPSRAQRADPALGGLVAGDVVIVVDDSAEIQLAMSSLLTAWGYRAFAAASVAELMPSLMQLDVTPRLILCDFRLRNGDDGITAIAELREAFNAEVPALLVTGDTAPDRLRMATASGMPLLHKPVMEDQLREAIALAVPPVLA